MKLYRKSKNFLRKSPLYRHARFFVTRMFNEELTYYAAGLSFYTISTIIPIFFIIFTMIPKLSQFDAHYDTLKSFLIEHLMPVQQDLITSYIDDFIANATQLGIFSLIFTIVVSMLFFVNFSYVVNTIFKSKSHHILKTLGTYFLLVILVPIGLIISFYFTGKINHFIDAHVFDFGVQVTALTPFFIEWTLFFLIYKFAPNTFVYYKAAAITAIITVFIWSVTKALFVHYVLFAKATSTIYGPFAITIFFLTWIYLSWIIFVYGLRLCYLINRSYGYSQSHNKQEVKHLFGIKGTKR